MTAIDYDILYALLMDISHSIIFSLPLLASPNRIRHRTYLGENKLKSRLESDSESESNGLLVKLLRGL